MTNEEWLQLRDDPGEKARRAEIAQFENALSEAEMLRKRGFIIDGDHTGIIYLPGHGDSIQRVGVQTYLCLKVLALGVGIYEMKAFARGTGLYDTRADCRRNASADSHSARSSSNAIAIDPSQSP